jgi:predicted phosphodiesterase
MASISKDKAIEIIKYVLDHGRAETLKAYALSDETFNRYKREAKKYFGDKIDLILQMNESYSDKELKAIASGGRIVPGFAKAPIVSFEGEEITFGVLSDTHIGSIYTDEQDIITALDEMKKKNVQFIVHPGDITEGMSGRDGHVYELDQIGYRAQRAKAVEILKRWEGPFYAVSGNHDQWFMGKADMGGDIVEDICKELPNGIYLGPQEGDISINGIVIRLFHGGDGASYALSYRLQKVIESWTGGIKPNVLITGHDHKSMYLPNYRNVQAVAGGTMQKQTSFMRGKKLIANVGFWIIKMGVADGQVKWFEPRWYPYYI